MKSRISKIFAILVVAFGGLLAVSNFARAEEIVKTPSEVKISKIPLECKKIKSHLKKVRSSDALKRVNLGQNYENISNNLMERLNLAAVSNKMNAGQLVAVSAEFSQKFANFKEKYQEYERELVRVVEYDCSQNAAGFYEEIEKMRVLRRDLHDISENLTNLSKSYMEFVEEFRKEVK